MFEIKRYSKDRAGEWNAFVARSKNGTFLFDRNYMDYHSDRFADSSLMFYKSGKLYAVLPANRVGDTLYSHQGLTYGGLVMDEACTAEGVLTLFMEMNEWLRADGVRRVVYKPIPYIYASLPSEEDLYALFRCGATLTARGISTAFDFHHPIRWNENRRRCLVKSRKRGVVVKVADDMSAFWDILSKGLLERHGVKPVHTLEEMIMLRDRFPERICLYVAEDADGNVIGGMLFYKTGRVLHSQYISSSEQGRKEGALEAIVARVCEEQGFDYFDFGISTEGSGLTLNEGLIHQKEGFGGRGVCYDRYEYLLK